MQLSRVISLYSVATLYQLIIVTPIGEGRQMTEPYLNSMSEPMLLRPKKGTEYVMIQSLMYSLQSK